jgi:hypothetical protein
MTAGPSRAIRLCGTETVDTPSRLLTAGPLTAELEAGALRYIRIGGIEVLRAIAFLVRDENWGTFSPKIENLKIEESPQAFRVTYRATCADAKRTLVYDAAIAGKSDGSLAFEAVADPLTDVETNRTGFIVLHPVKGVAGAPVKVLHVDGREETSAFPAAIDPMCPFQDIRALSHEVMPGLWATCSMEGDTFEMEDQRNWSDASYKTYVRPLIRPWPYVLPKGVKVPQAVRLSFTGPLPPAVDGNPGERIAVTLGEAAGAIPAIGIGVPAEEAAHALTNLDLIKRLGPKWLVCEIDLRKNHGRAELDAYRRLGEATAAGIVLEIVTAGGMDPAKELAPVGEAVRASGLKPSAIAVFPAQDMKSVLPGSKWPEMPTFDEIYAAARAAFPGVKLGGGMATYFTELNRKRPPAKLIDYVTHTTCPNVHAADDRSVMETMEALPYQILSTRGFMGERLPYRIGPSQLACRENAYGKATAPNPGNNRVCLSRIDPRQRGLFNAAWTIAYVAAFAEGGVEAIALGAPTGPMGFVHRKGENVAPWFDDLGKPAVYPAFHVMAALAAAAGRSRIETESSKPAAVAALAWKDGGKTVLWLANLTGEKQTVALPAGAREAAVLDADAFERAATDPGFLAGAAKPAGETLALDAYAVARVTV